MQMESEGDKTMTNKMKQLGAEEVRRSSLFYDLLYIA